MQREKWREKKWNEGARDAWARGRGGSCGERWENGRKGGKERTCVPLGRLGRVEGDVGHDEILRDPGARSARDIAQRARSEIARVTCTFASLSTFSTYS
eukprot:1383634-Rhodomonas_salina.2